MSSIYTQKTEAILQFYSPCEPPTSLHPVIRGGDQTLLCGQTVNWAYNAIEIFVVPFLMMIAGLQSRSMCFALQKEQIIKLILNYTSKANRYYLFNSFQKANILYFQTENSKTRFQLMNSRLFSAVLLNKNLKAYPILLISVFPFDICLGIYIQGYFSLQIQPRIRLGGSLFTDHFSYFQDTSPCVSYLYHCLTSYDNQCQLQAAMPEQKREHSELSSFTVSCLIPIVKQRFNLIKSS